jgi:hypothetical protein
VAVVNSFLGITGVRKTPSKPVDKSVTKLWKDRAEQRRYWLGAIAYLASAYSRKLTLHNLTCRVKRKNFPNVPQSLMHSGFQCLYLPPIIVDVPVDKVRAILCSPCLARPGLGWLFYEQRWRQKRVLKPCPWRARAGMLWADFH